MEKKQVTLQVIADKALVSKALVSRVLNNRPVRVSDQKKEQILRIANELDYIPSGKILQAAPLPGLGKTIALILPHLNYSFMSVLADTITKEAYKNGYSVILFDSKEDSALELKYLELCHSLRVSGIILDSFNNVSNKKYLEKLSSWKIPTVFIDCYPNDPRFSILSSKNKEAMFQLTENLILRGHQNILSIVQDRSALTNVSMERLNGYYAAMDKHGLFGYNEIIYPNRDYKQQPVFSLMNSSRNFTAFIIHTASDVQHFCELLPITKYAGRTDFELGVFDDFNIPFSEYILGTNKTIYEKIVSIISQRPKEMASGAVHLLLENIKKGDSFIPVHNFIDYDFLDVSEIGINKKD